MGGEKEIPFKTRIIAASNVELESLIKSGNFREDLYYRINVIELNIPPLRERMSDLPILAEFMLTKISEQNGDTTYSISKDALDKFQMYPFPGNIRELENILERSATLCDGNQITAQDLDLPESKSPTQSDQPDPNESSITLSVDQLEDYLIQKERKAIIAALEKTRWNKTAAAKLLGITFRQLRYRLQKLELE